MAEAARAAGLQYIAITDHTPVAGDGQRAGRAAGARACRPHPRARRGGLGIRLLAGVECDIRPDGTLDLADDCLAALDLVVASVHSAFNQDRQQMTDRLLRAIENPHVDILGHPTGRRILKREPYAVDIEAVVDAAARHGVAHRDQLPGRSARSQRRPCEARARSRRAARHLERRALAPGVRPPALGRPGGAPRLAAAGGRPQHARRSTSSATAPAAANRGVMRPASCAMKLHGC